MSAHPRVFLWPILLASACVLAGCGGVTPIQTHFNKGVYHHSRGALDQAIAEYREALEEDPDDFRARFNLGHALEARAAEVERRGDRERAAALRKEAREAYETILVSHPDNVRAAANLAAMDFEAGETDRAEERLQDLIRRHPDQVIAHTALGAQRLRAGRLEEARQILEEACDVRPGNEYAWYLLGLVRRRLGETEEAREAFLNTLERDPDDVAALVALGEVELEAARPAEALSWFSSALGVDPAHYGANLGAARASMALGRWEAAVAHLWRARDHASDPREAETAAEMLPDLYRKLLDEAAQEVTR